MVFKAFFTKINIYILSIVCIFSVIGTPLFAAGEFVYVSQFGSLGSGNRQFNSPQGIALDSSGNIYVADSGNRRVQKFDSSGTYLSQFGSSGSGDGQFGPLNGIAVDSSGNIYVVDVSAVRIQKFNSAGTYLSQFGSLELGTPSGIAIDSNGDIYVSDIGDSTVKKYNPSGTYLSQFGSFGTGDGQFGSPRGIAFDSSGNIYVVDSASNRRVQKFDSSGTYLSQFGSFGTGDGQFNSPQGIALDSSGNIYVVDGGNRRVQKFDSSGTYLSQFGSLGTGDGQFNGPQGIALDASRNVYVVDTNNRRVQKLSQPDLTAPTISSTATSTTQTTATVTWTTDEAATSTVNFGLTSSYGTASSSAVSTTTHRFVLTSLTPDTTYHFRISSWDGSSNLATSSDLTFTTLDATTQSPTLISPTAGTYTNTTPMSVSFILPETPLANSITLTFTPSTGPAIILNLRDAAPSVTNTFSLPLTSGITTSVTEVLSATADSIPAGTYTVTIAYQDALGNPVAYVSSTDVIVADPVVTPTPSGSSGGKSGSRRSSGLGSSSTTPTIPQAPSNPSVSFRFTRDLSYNTIHPEVLELQKFLNAKGFTVSVTGPGSVGKETNKFGPATRAALIKFQKAKKITPAIGYFGPVTRGVVGIK